MKGREQHVPWLYALHFFRSSLALRSGQTQETLVAIHHLRMIAALANGRGDAAISATAALMEAMTHLIRTSVPESIENAQTALAAARGSQVNPLADGIHQLTVMGLLVDLCCQIYRNETEGALTLMKEFIASVDNIIAGRNWDSDGLFLIPLTSQSAGMIPSLGLTNGVICPDKGKRLCLRMFWIGKHAIFSLGYMVCAAVNMHRNSQDSKAEEYLKEAAGLCIPGVICHS